MTLPLDILNPSETTMAEHRKIWIACDNYRAVKQYHPRTQVRKDFHQVEIDCGPFVRSINQLLL